MTMLTGNTPFRRLDSRSWSASTRIEDMDRDGVTLQVLSPMPELLSYWMAADVSELLCLHLNDQIATIISSQPKRFRGLGAVPLQDPQRAVEMLPRLKSDFGLSGVEIGSNINGTMLGDRRFDAFYAAAEELGMAIFVHALHPVATRSIEATPQYTGFVGFPIDVAMAAASLIVGGTIERFPHLRIGFSHGGGAIGAILGRLDVGWEKANRYDTDGALRPSEQARRLYFDSNVYDPEYLRHIATNMAPGRVFVGTDYPYDIMQREPRRFTEQLDLGAEPLRSLRWGAACDYLDEDLECVFDARSRFDGRP